MNLEEALQILQEMVERPRLQLEERKEMEAITHMSLGYLYPSITPQQWKAYQVLQEQQTPEGA